MKTSTTRPNLLVILVDDMGYGDFSAFNDGLSATPALDALIAESVCLTQHYTASPVCNPSRACLLTGRYPHRTGSIDTLEWRGLERLALRERTLADVLSAAGYRTGLVGKWHLGAFDPRYHPQRRGFDETVCFRGGMHDYYDWRIEFGTDLVRRGDGTYLTDLWTDEACGFICRHSNEPFFLHVAYNAPHTPLQAPDAAVAPFLEREDLTSAVAKLYGMLAAMDGGVARILETLDRQGLSANTIVLFSSDNGPQFGGRGDDRLDRFNCGFNGAKGAVYEGGIRVPGILRWPAGLDGGRRCDRMVHFADWLPTLLALLEVDPPPDQLPLDGLDVSAVLRGDAGDVCEQRCWQWNRYAPKLTSNAAIRDGDWKLVRPHMAGAGVITEADMAWLHTSMYDPQQFIDGGIIREPWPDLHQGEPPPLELYDLAADPREQHNLAAARPEIAHRLQTNLETWFESVEADRLAIPVN